jgi:hypothetical protein
MTVKPRLTLLDNRADSHTRPAAKSCVVVEPRKESSNNITPKPTNSQSHTNTVSKPKKKIFSTYREIPTQDMVMADVDIERIRRIIKGGEVEMFIENVETTSNLINCDTAKKVGIQTTLNKFLNK